MVSVCALDVGLLLFCWFAVFVLMGLEVGLTVALFAIVTEILSVLFVITRPLDVGLRFFLDVAFGGAMEGVVCLPPRFDVAPRVW